MKCFDRVLRSKTILFAFNHLLIEVLPCEHVLITITGTAALSVILGWALSQTFLLFLGLLILLVRQPCGRRGFCLLILLESLRASLIQLLHLRLQTHD